MSTSLLFTQRALRTRTARRFSRLNAKAPSKSTPKNPAGTASHSRKLELLSSSDSRQPEARLWGKYAIYRTPGNLLLSPRELRKVFTQRNTNIRLIRVNTVTSFIDSQNRNISSITVTVTAPQATLCFFSRRNHKQHENVNTSVPRPCFLPLQHHFFNTHTKCTSHMTSHIYYGPTAESVNDI